MKDLTTLSYDELSDFEMGVNTKLNTDLLLLEKIGFENMTDASTDSYFNSKTEIESSISGLVHNRYKYERLGNKIDSFVKREQYEKADKKLKKQKKAESKIKYFSQDLTGLLEEHENIMTNIKDQHQKYLFKMELSEMLMGLGILPPA